MLSQEAHSQLSNSLQLARNMPSTPELHTAQKPPGASMTGAGKDLQKCSTCFSNSCWAVRGCQHSTYVPTVAGPTFNISTSARAEPGASPHTSKSCLLRPAKPPENRSQTHEISKILRRFVSQPLYEYQLPRLCHFRTHTKTVELEGMVGKIDFLERPFEPQTKTPR